MSCIYNPKHVISYHGADVFTLEEEAILPERDKQFVRDVLYRHDLLSVLCLEEFDEARVNDSIQNLYEKCKQDPNIEREIKETMKTIETEDEIVAFMSLFSFDRLCETHLLISAILTVI
jgi:hypothetical protein